VLEKQAKLVQKHLSPRRGFLSHDEIPCGGLVQVLHGGRKTPGELLAENVRRCVQIVRKLDEKARIIIWSDMFDPTTTRWPATTWSTAR